MKESIFKDDNNFFKSIELNNETGKMNLIKARGKKDPIGTIRNGRKKIAQGKWVPAKVYEIQRAALKEKTGKSTKLYKFNKKEVKDKIFELDSNKKEGMSSVRDVTFQKDGNINIETHAGTPIVGYLNKILKQVFPNQKYKFDYRESKGDTHLYIFNIK